MACSLPLVPLEIPQVQPQSHPPCDHPQQPSASLPDLLLHTEATIQSTDLPKSAWEPHSQPAAPPASAAASNDQFATAHLKALQTNPELLSHYPMRFVPTSAAIPSLPISHLARFEPHRATFVPYQAGISSHFPYACKTWATRSPSRVREIHLCWLHRKFLLHKSKKLGKF